MTVETITYITDYVNTNPDGSTSYVSELDNHIRGMKTGSLNTWAAFTGAAVDSTEAELSYNAGVTPGTATASKTVVLDASKNIATINQLTCTTAIVTNITFNGTALTVTGPELNYNHSVTPGTVSASKTVMADSNKDVTGFRNVTGTGTATFAALAGPLTGTASNASALNSQAGSYYLSRTNHTGTQTLSTISDAAALAAKDTIDSAALIDDAVITIAKLATATYSTGSQSVDAAYNLPAGVISGIKCSTVGRGSSTVQVLIGASWTTVATFGGTTVQSSDGTSYDYIPGTFFSNGSNVRINDTASSGSATYSWIQMN